MSLNNIGQEKRGGIIVASKYGGFMGKIIKIDLSTKEVSDYPWTDEKRELYLGGKIMAARIIYELIDKPIEPYGDNNILVFSTGPLTGSGAPSSSRFNVSTISPLTHYLASSNCGGSFGFHLKKAGYDAIIITGKSEKPIWIEINDGNIKFHDAQDLWGKTTTDTQELLGKKGGKVVIGPAGENLVRYAGIFSQDRTAGRGGAGAVMGSKNLKAILATGKQEVLFKDKEKSKELNKKWISFLKDHPITGKILPELGTANLVRRMQKKNMLATRNFSKGQYDDYEMLSGENLAANYLVKNDGCLTCPVKCSRVVEYKGKNIKGPELETIGLLGANLENNSLEKIIEWNYILDELGMDTMSAGGTIAFAMELQEKGMWDSGLHFGKTDNLSEVFEDIAYRRGIGDLLAEGSKYLANYFGGKEFAINSKGMELAAYEPRGATGIGLGYAVANRGGCHINAGYLVFLEGLGVAMDNRTPNSKAALNIMMQNLMEAVSGAGSCIFTSYALMPGIVLDDSASIMSKITNKILSISGPFVQILNRYPKLIAPIHLWLLPHTKVLSTLMGCNITYGKFMEIGSRGYNLERLVNSRLLLNSSDDTLPARLTEELQDPADKRSKVPLVKLKKDYYSLRGWDERGVPLEKAMKKLGVI